MPKRSPITEAEADPLGGDWDAVLPPEYPLVEPDEMTATRLAAQKNRPVQWATAVLNKAWADNKVTRRTVRSEAGKTFFGYRIVSKK